MDELNKIKRNDPLFKFRDGLLLTWLLTFEYLVKKVKKPLREQFINCNSKALTF